MRHLHVHGAIGVHGDEVVARSDEVAAAGVDIAHPRNHAEVAQQARRRVGR